MWRTAKSAWLKIRSHLLDKILLASLRKRRESGKESHPCQILGACNHGVSPKSRPTTRKSSASKIDVVNTDCCCQAASAICLSCLNPRTGCLLFGATHIKQDTKHDTSTNPANQRLLQRSNTLLFLQAQCGKNCEEHMAENQITLAR